MLIILQRRNLAEIVAKFVVIGCSVFQKQKLLLPRGVTSIIDGSLNFMRLPCVFLLINILTAGTSVHASGNRPDAGACPPETPYFAFCTHSLHSLEGWHSRHCHTTAEAAQKDAETHAAKYHQGNTRWTGIKKPR
jgi:hypothetical protein